MESHLRLSLADYYLIKIINKMPLFIDNQYERKTSYPSSHWCQLLRRAVKYLPSVHWTPTPHGNTVVQNLSYTVYVKQQKFTPVHCRRQIAAPIAGKENCVISIYLISWQ